MASINEKLNKIDDNIADMRTILNLEKNTSIENVKNALTPEKGFIINEWNENGYATKITTYGMSTIPDYYFAAETSNIQAINKNLNQVILNEGITSFGSCAFKDCSQLKEVNFPNSLKTIKNYAFGRCSSLKINRWPDTVTTIANQTFQSCTSLIQMSMANVTNIGTADNYAVFAQCTNLKAVWIGSAITSAGFRKYAFYGCSALKKMFIDLPRAQVETFINYQYTFSNNTFGANVIICNDDEGFISKEEFDAIDWSTYTE